MSAPVKQFRQLPLALQLRNPTRLQDFVAGENAAVLELLEQQRSLAEPLLYLCGEPASGRSHLLLGQCASAQDQGLQVAYLPGGQHAELHPQLLEGLEQLDLVAIDDVDRLAGQADWELALFNLFNRARAENCRLLFSAREIPAQAGFELPDLRSRLAWGISYRLQPLGDENLEHWLISLAQRRGLDMPEDVARYLLTRHSREQASLLALLDRLDRDSLAEQRRLSIPFVRTRLA